MQPTGGIELVVVPGEAEIPATRHASPGVLPGLDQLPAPCVIGLVSGQDSESLAALRRLAGELTAGVAVTAGVRELLCAGGFGCEYLGQWPLGSAGPETGLWRLHNDAGRALGHPALRNAPASELSLAVLPFRARGGDEAMQDLAWGISDDLTAALSRFRSFEVLARGAAWPWRQSPLPSFEIGHRIGVRYLLDGLVRPAGTRLRLDLSLADTVTARAIWAERYVIAPDELRKLTGEAMQTVAAAIAHHLQLDAVESSPMPNDGAGDGRAHLLALQGRARLHGNTGDDLDAAEALADTALALDPGCAAALALRARCGLNALMRDQGGDEEKLLVRALQHALSATRADPRDGRAYAALALARLLAREFDAAGEAISTALELGPGDADILAEAARIFVHLGRAGEAQTLIERAMRLNPYYPDDWLWTAGAAHLLAGTYREALGAALRMQHPRAAHLIKAASHARLGQPQAAEAAAAAQLAAEPGFTSAAWRQRLPWRDPSDIDLWVEALQQAGLP